MIIKKKIRSLQPYRKLIPNSKDLFIGAVDPRPFALKRAGFADEATDGETILPRAVGRTSAYNAYGKRIVRRDLPMETAYTTIMWHWTEWHGRYKVEQSDYRDRPYKRYPRDYIEPPALELSLCRDTAGNRVVMAPLIQDWRQNEKAVIHAVNLELELFGQCQFYDQERKSIIAVPIKRVNWDILPPGRHPFSQIAEAVKYTIRQVRPAKREFAEHRLEVINSYGPDFTAIGAGGFSGYIVFGFEERNTFILESILYGNATYILENNWEVLSQKTKAEILNNSLHKQRIIHMANWDEKVKTALSEF